MFSFKPKKVDVLSHWYVPVPNFTLSTQDFYAAVEKELKEQQVPGLDISRVEFAEGGMLSDKRGYMRMTRERLVFDVCAAPFGINYFFSCRFAELPVIVNPLAFIILFFIFFIPFVASFQHLGFFGTLYVGIVYILPLIALVIYCLRNVISFGLADVDAAFLKIPLWNGFYERFLRKETYYRYDTRLMYLTVVEGIVKKLVEQETAAKGVKILTQYEYGPILGELYKPRPFGVENKAEST